LFSQLFSLPLAFKLKTLQMQTVIKLNNIRFFAYHGVLPHEAVVGNWFVVNIRIEADLSAACQSDNVEDTINYAEVYNIIKAEMEIPAKLIERVACRILRSIKNAFPQITAIEVRLAKMSPPIVGDVGSAEIVVSE
jgi:dihydroneopterin aldolase